MSRVVAIDLGSNTCRAIEYDCETETFGRECERIVKTADRVHETGIINDGAIARVIDALKEADRVFDLAHTRHVAVTTAAMRMAANRETVLAKIEHETGVRFEVIDADREAFYALTAVQARLRRLELKADSLAMIDIGGGSTEVIFYQHGRRTSRSFSIGIVTVAQRCAVPDDVHALLDTELAPVRDFVDAYGAENGKPDTLVSTAGTPTTISAYLMGMTYTTYDPQKVNGYVLTMAGCQTALDGLRSMDDNTRAATVGVGRETLIVAGVVIVMRFFELLGYASSVVIDDGVREGVAIAACSG